ncbi:hypothetical protein BKA56DRAFT_673227 [Ilyonectria sp. MPI-CAGE-AT-0026]|nr:hypothetical protein BKA56DRAFT_673227 [Ilyonectria sp. MPI-CAGE-AT-0026]
MDTRETKFFNLVAHACVRTCHYWPHIDLLPQGSGYEKALRHQEPQFHVSAAGDHHTGNTYIDGVSNTGFLDRQTLHIGSAFHGFTCFIVGALFIEGRRACRVPPRYRGDIVEHAYF